MSRWFRHYAGMMRDDKLVRAAVIAKQPVERVVWIWGAILESAAEIDDDGRFDVDAAEISYFLRSDLSDVTAVLAALEQAGRVSGGRVAKWNDRQFKSDRSSERQKSFRDRQKQASDDDRSANKGAVVCERDGRVTSPSRHGDAPETETETETETESPPSEEKRASARKRSPSDELATVLDPERVAAVIDHRQRIRKPLTAHAAKLLAGKFARCRDPCAAADAMIANGWQGFEPEWLDNRNGTGNGQQHRRVTAAEQATASMGRVLAQLDRNGERGPDAAGERDGDDGSGTGVGGLPGRAETQAFDRP